MNRKVKKLLLIVHSLLAGYFVLVGLMHSPYENDIILSASNDPGNGAIAFQHRLPTIDQSVSGPHTVNDVHVVNESQAISSLGKTPTNVTNVWRKPKVPSKFKAIDNASLYLLTTSAYWDHADQIRVFGLVTTDPENYQPRLKCKFDQRNHHNKSHSPIVTDGTVHRIKEFNNTNRYTACYVLCHTTPEVIAMQHQIVRITSRGEDSSRRAAPVIVLTIPVQQRTFNVTSQFTLCVGPIGDPEAVRVHKLAEMISFNKLLGADKIFFYDYNVGAAATEAFHHYRKNRQNLVSIVDWTLPLKGTGEDIKEGVNDFAKVTAMNDCLYRNRFQSRYVMFVDTAEYLVPNMSTTFDTWKDVIHYHTNINPKANVFSFVCTVFPMEWGGIETKNLAYFIKGELSIAFGHPYRENRFIGVKDGCNHMMSPSVIDTVGTNASLNTVDGAAVRQFVPGSDAAMYRYWSGQTPPLNSTNAQKQIFDSGVMRHYQHRVHIIVRNDWTKIKRKLKKEYDNRVNNTSVG